MSLANGKSPVRIKAALMTIATVAGLALISPGPAAAFGPQCFDADAVIPDGTGQAAIVPVFVDVPADQVVTDVNAGVFVYSIRGPGTF